MRFFLRFGSRWNRRTQPSPEATPARRCGDPAYLSYKDRHIGRSAARGKCGKPLRNPNPELETREQHRKGWSTDFPCCSRIKRPPNQTNRIWYSLEMPNLYGPIKA